MIVKTYDFNTINKWRHGQSIFYRDGKFSSDFGTLIPYVYVSRPPSFHFPYLLITGEERVFYMSGGYPYEECGTEDNKMYATEALAKKAADKLNAKQEK